ncbi:MAG: hypothetical protein J6R44_03445, partial [Clostridia bacterium]|nr:hypothetical protein [Clostridia bacterium]
NMTTIPCFAAVAAAKGELSTKKKFTWTLVFWVATSYIASSMIYLVGSWWWTVFIFLAVWALVITIIVLYNKGKISFEFVKKIAKKLIKTKNSPSSCGCGGCAGCSIKDKCPSSKK